MEMTRTSDQKISERTPSTLSWVTGELMPVVRHEALFERVQRARADVAVDDAERAEGEREEVAATGLIRMRSHSRGRENVAA